MNKNETKILRTDYMAPCDMCGQTSKGTRLSMNGRLERVHVHYCDACLVTTFSIPVNRAKKGIK